jgi:hypothetical protein
MTQIRLNLPTQTPRGQYLLRIDSIWPGIWIQYEETGDEWHLYKEAQIYGACLQIDVESDYDGSLPEGIYIPEQFNTSALGKSSRHFLVSHTESLLRFECTV